MAMLLSANEDRRYFIRILLRNILHERLSETFYVMWVGGERVKTPEQNNLAKLILDTRKLIDAKIDDSGATVLHFAAQNGNVEVSQYLIDRGSDVNAQDQFGNTPLMYVLLEHEKKSVGPVIKDKSGTMMELIKILLKAGADCYLPNNEGMNATQVALNLRRARYHTGDIIKIFLEAVKKRCKNDAELMAKDLMDNDCPLERALVLDNPNLTRIMISRGRSVNEVYAYGGSKPLHRAVDLMSLENVKVLIELGANVYAEDNQGWTPLQYYLIDDFSLHDNTDHREEPEIVKIFMNIIKDVNKRNRGRFIVKSVVKNGNEESLQVLLQYDIDFRVQDIFGCTLLHHIAENHLENVAQLLKDQDFDPNVRNGDGDTALLNAISERNTNTNTIQFLLENGADPNVIDVHSEFNPLIHAVSQCNLIYCGGDFYAENVALLLDYGADVQWYQDRSVIEHIQDNGYHHTAEMPLAHLAIDEVLGKPIKSLIRKQISANPTFQNHVDKCKQKLEDMMKITVHGSLTMFTFLSVSEESIVRRYSYNPELLEKLESIKEETHLNTYYDSLVRKRLARIIPKIELMQKTALIICSFIRVNKSVDSIIAREIMSYLEYKDMQNLNKLELE